MIGRRSLCVALVVAALAGCSSDAGDGASSPSTAPSGPGAPAGPVVAGDGACDPVDGAGCLLPWPNDRFTRADEASATGLRLDLPGDGMPANASGVRIDPTEWNRNDGFAPASTLITVIDDLDVEASGLPPVTDLASSLDDGSSLVLWDVDAGERVAAWAELDANAEDPSDRALLIQPAATLAEGHRHVVGLRGLVRTDGSEVEPDEAFAALLAEPDALASGWFDALEGAGVDRDELDVAWGFTVGSGDDISGRLRHMWAETSAEVGDGAPPFTVDSVAVDGPASLVRGTFEVPNYLTGDGAPGEVMNNGDDPDGIPERNGSMDVEYLCMVPTSAQAEGADPAPVVVYGHGLLGSRNEALGIGAIGASAGVSFCAVDWLGMSTADVASLVEGFEDLTGFRATPDRLQQGHLSFLLLGRLVRSSEGFTSDPAFQRSDGSPALDADQVSFLGASQGGILGGVPSALTSDWTKVVLAVPGLGYNLLLRRSIDFDEFAPIVEANYADELDQTLLLDLLEQLWQRGENAGWAQHITADTFDGAPEKDVLLLEAFGDHQVANVSTQKLARSLGIGRRAPTLADGRSNDEEPYALIDPVELPADSALVTWDFGTPTPPDENLPNRAGEDPHGKLAEVPEALALLVAFIAPDGAVIDVCGDGPCQAPG